jgi:photosystem II stability/assembly factor-like uncharacterized protein
MRHKTHHRQHPLTGVQASAAHHPDTPGKYISTLLHLILILLTATLTTQAQWDIEESHTTASLRGIHNVGGGVAWASGTKGTVLRTEDGGYLWQTCNMPPGAENLDFRGIQAFDENTAIVMSSGPGDQSRLYKTTDACQTWKLLFTNPDKQGFWDALKFQTKTWGWLLGDPVNHRFVLLATFDGGLHWQPVNQPGLAETPGEGGAFAASNSLILAHLPLLFGTARGWLYQGNSTCTMGLVHNHPQSCMDLFDFVKKRLPIAHDSDSAGIFSLSEWNQTDIAVGGDYKKSDSTQDTAAFSLDLGQHWQTAQTPPHGYRSSVAYDAQQKLWITVGPNGTDISRDDGKNWQPLKPSGYDPADADKNWNALSLPFVVGPSGRIGRLRTITVPQNKSAQ